MSVTAKFLLAGVLLASVFGAMSTGLATIVSYAPFGVAPSQRADYEEQVALIKRRESLRRNSKEMGLPQAVVPALSYDFGLVDPHTTATHSFEIRNQGAGPLTLDVAETTCKCTVGNAASNVLLPGESTTIDLTWNTGKKAENYEQIARVVTNDPTRKVIDLSVTGVVKSKLFVPENGLFRTVDAGEQATATLFLHSQLHDEFAVVDVESDLPGLQWEAKQVSVSSQPSLNDRSPASVTELQLNCLAQRAGKFSGEVKVQVLLPGQAELSEHVVQLTGRVHAPISFHSPMLHSKEGLDLGTLANDADHEFHLVVRKHFSEDRELAVLNVEPKILEVSIEPSHQESDYRLTIRIPRGADSEIFNLDQKRGYIQVGDPSNQEFSNWFPVIGAVIANAN
ncbi:DUF1573 domain-containing protein [Rhodopirellula sp. JC740]|uniref:DUF1573 domain-containing protein n=1 Tax=Rhodopirellula halodulae TaxID=2894198 RepID=A0ABS8NKR7_9BACT|nr:DUF1573 domain-containing protein [Rhodopirellula sp. JC740]MCC9644132.1 DUF1573 domain-containing protein [Rhodopirellula sp. JC740]